MRKNAWLMIWIIAAPLFSQNRFPLNVSPQALSTVPADKFCFAVLGDRTGSGPESWKIFDGAVLDLNQLRPDFGIMIGDLIEGAPERTVLLQQWSEAERHLESLQFPLFSIPGNHDIPNSQAYSVWSERFGKTYHSFDYRGCHFLMLDTEESQGTGQPGFGSEQLAFAEKDILENQNTRHFFVFMHQPLWIGDGFFKSQWTRLESLLPKAGTTIVAGHVHALAMKKQNGHTYVISGPTGGKLRLERNPSLGMVTQFTWVTVENGICTPAFIEPGRVITEKTALEAYDRFMKMLMLLKGQTGS